MKTVPSLPDFISRRFLLQTRFRPLVALLILGLILGLSPMGQVAEGVGQVLKVSGKAWVKHEKSFIWEQLIAGGEVLEGDSLYVASGEVELSLAQGSRMRLASGTRITFTSSSHLRLDLGEAWFHVQNQLLPWTPFSVETPAAVVGVRGTIFAVLVEASGATTVRVLTGEVSAKTLSEEVVLGPWMYTIISPEGETRPPLLGHRDEPEWSSFIKWAEKEMKRTETGEEGGNDEQGDHENHENKENKPGGEGKLEENDEPDGAPRYGNGPANRW